LASFDIGQVKQLAKPAASRTPTLGGIVAEILWIQWLERPAALWTGAFRRMHADLAAMVEGEKRPTAQLQRFVNKLLKAWCSALGQFSWP
jgi:hypothetical protein